MQKRLESVDNQKSGIDASRGLSRPCVCWRFDASFASGDIDLGYNAPLLSPILDKVRANYHGAITDLHVTLYAQQDAVHVPYVLKALREYDRGYGTAYAADVARLFIRLVHLTARGQRVESTVKTETVKRYLTSLGEFLPEGLKQMLVPEV